MTDYIIKTENGSRFCLNRFDRLDGFMKKLVIFGFDGTLADTSPGIVYCINTTAAAMGYTPIKHDAMYGVIGFPIEEAFKKLFNMKDDEIEYATNNYSKLYSQKGKEMFIVYDGITDLLHELKKNGLMLAIATQKHIMFTSDMLEILEADDVFDAVCATDVGTNLTKSDLLLQACSKLGVSVEESVLVGDSCIEAQSAEQIGMDFIAALYGWGFKSREDAEKFKCKGCVESASQILPNVLTL